MSSLLSSISTKLSKPTSIFNLPLWSVIIIIIILLIILLLFICASCQTWQGRKRRKFSYASSNPGILCQGISNYSSSIDKRLLSHRGWEFEMNSDRWMNQMNDRSDLDSMVQCSRASIEVLRVGKEYKLSELEEATNGWGYDNVIGCGDYGIVYSGVLSDHTHVAVKKSEVDYSDDEVEELKVEMEALRCVRQKNLVKLLGYCFEESNRFTVYEYMENDSLHNWLHGFVGEVSPLTWQIRLNIIIGTGKGLAYLHEDTEPPIVHQRIKASNILLDNQWNPKISDFATAKLFGPGYHNSRASQGMNGYLDPEYACTGILNEKTDVYSFGILIMEIITGQRPIRFFEGEIEEYLIDWFKSMVKNQLLDQVVDPKLAELPSLKELKRVVLIALRCVDPDVENRPKMGAVIHMLEPRDLLLSDERVTGRVFRKVSRSSRPVPRPALFITLSSVCADPFVSHGSSS